MNTPAGATFQAGAPLWWSLSARQLGWRPDEFWRATPAELAGALRDPENLCAASPPSRDLIAQMLERDRHGK